MSNDIFDRDFYDRQIFDRTFFLQKEKDLLLKNAQLSAALNYLEKALPYIVLRVNTLSTADNIDSFALTTSANPADAIVYTSSLDQLKIQIKDGGLF